MTELRQRQPRVRDEGFLAFVRKQACCACGAVGRSQAAHIRMACKAIGKRSTGMQEKPDDRWAVPLCGPQLFGGLGPPQSGCHAEQHSGSEIEFWQKWDLNPFKTAMWLFAVYEAKRPEKAAHAISEATPSKPKHRKQTHRRLAVATTRPKRKIASRPFAKVKRKFR